MAIDRSITATGKQAGPAPKAAPARAVADSPAGTTAPSVPAEEVRLAVVLNGGVSLAVWMGGVSLELHRFGAGQSIYGALQRLAGCTARIDVIAGTSAGGINGAALALAQANSKARLAELRDVWTDQGQIETLLRSPFRGSPTSLLRGDEYFLPKLNEAMQSLATPFEPTPAEERPIDLTITTTLLHGVQKVTVDSTGQRLPQSIHEGRFHFRRGAPATAPTAGEAGPVAEDDPFAPSRINLTADRLALAARCTASFPVAFEPSFVPVDRQSQHSLGDDERRLRPDMGDVASWSSRNRDEPGWVAAETSKPHDVSRFAVDGGLLANMPTRSALQAIDSMPASGPVRRTMLLIHPHAPSEQIDTADDPLAPPTVAGSLGAILGSLTAQGSRTFVEQIEQHNLRAAGRRGTRSDVLTTADTAARLHSLAGTVFEQYRRLRMWRAGRDVASLVAPQEGWSAERIRRNAQRAQEQWYADRRAAADGRPPLPYVPAGLKNQPATGWAWGISAAVGVADSAADVLRKMIWVLPAGPDYEAVLAARRATALLRQEIQRCSDLTDRMWRVHPVLRTLEPTQTLFTLRLAWYEWAMLGDPGEGGTALRGQLESLIDDVSAHEALRGAAPSERRQQQVRDALSAQLLGGNDPASLRRPGAIGARVAALVGEVVAQVKSVQHALGVLCTSPHPELDAALAPWGRVFVRAASDAEILQRLLALEVATTALGDETASEYSLPLELIQLSAQTRNGFATASRTADDKLGGMAISRFGGFLKRSWRLNDWAWGRMDAATVLCRLVLDPARVRRSAELAGILGPRSDAESLAGAAIEELLTVAFGPHSADAGAPPIPDFEGLRADAQAELAQAFSDIPIGDLPPTMPRLAELAAWGIHLRTIVEELPALARAIRADGVAGANPRSNGELLVSEHADLIRRLEAVSSAAAEEEEVVLTPSSMRDAVAGLRAFDRAGVGRESLREEGTSDQMLRTATSAAAVAATVVDSDRSGAEAIKPVTRAVRGGMLLPYWIVTGLTAGGALSRALALLGLSAGAVLLALALFGALPAWASGVGAAFGASALLVAFAYSALRTGTLLHGLVLLTPVVPLLAIAVERSGGDPQAVQSFATLAVVVALALGLMLLGSLPAPMLSVWGELDRAADRAGIKPVPADLVGSRLGAAQAVRRARAVARLLLKPLLVLLAVGLAGAGVVLAVSGEAWNEIGDAVLDNRAAALAGVGGAAAIGLLVAWRQGHSLSAVFDESEAVGTDLPAWRFHPVRHPAGVLVGWSVVYGIGYLLIAVLLLWDPWGWLDEAWAKAALTTALVFAVVLLLVVPVVAPWRAKRRFEHEQAARTYRQLRLGRLGGDVDTRGLALTRRGRRLARQVGASISTDGARRAQASQRNAAILLADLVQRGHAYRFLVKTSTVTAPVWQPSAWGADSVTVTFGNDPGRDDVSLRTEAHAPAPARRTG